MEDNRRGGGRGEKGEVEEKKKERLSEGKGKTMR